MMRRIFFLLMLALSALACTLTDDFLGTEPSAAPTPMLQIPSDDGLPVSRAEDGAFTLGYADAPMTIIVFADWYCPHCQNYKPTVDRLIETYVTTGQLKYEYRVLPTAGGENTYQLGKWIECAAESGENFFKISDALYDLLFNGYQTADQVQASLGDRFGLSASKMTDCSESADQIDIDLDFADALGVSSTPSVWIRYADGTVELVEDRSFEGISSLIENAGGQA